MKLKALITAIGFLIAIGPVTAQTFSSWVTDSAISTLKVRQALGKDASGNSVIFLQVASTVPCQLYLTASVCEKDARETNGWRFVKFTRHSTLELTFKIMNSCNNGFWWWRKDYQ